VEIRQTSGDGFTVRWTTVLHQGGDKNNPDARKRGAQLTFRPSTRPGVWLSIEASDALSPNGYGWATIDGNTLTISLLTVNEQGRYNIQVYDRILNDRDMALKFRRLVDGAKGRIVRGNLVRVGN
jgi:hypothetical protein